MATLAGGGSKGGTASGHTDGTGVAATFSNPHGVAIDSSGFVIMADPGNNRIRKGVFVLALPACDASWRHVAVTYSPTASSSLGTLSAFLDGMFVTWAALAISLPAAASSTLRVGWGGSSSVNSGSLYAGSLADLRLFNRTLSASEIIALSQPPLATSFAGAGLVAASPAAVGASAYLFSCAAGGFGPPATLAKSAVDSSWAWASPPQCAACPAGTWSSPGASACSLCSPGTYSFVGAAACSPCPPGTYGA